MNIKVFFFSSSFSLAVLWGVECVKVDNGRTGAAVLTGTFLNWVRKEYWGLEILLFPCITSKNSVGPLDSFLSSLIFSLSASVKARDLCRACECKCILPRGWPAVWRCLGRFGGVGWSWEHGQRREKFMWSPRTASCSLVYPGGRWGDITILAPQRGAGGGRSWMGGNLCSLVSCCPTSAHVPRSCL